jgi:hypothetical protein
MLPVLLPLRLPLPPLPHRLPPLSALVPAAPVFSAGSSATALALTPMGLLTA